jgi:NTP pyrophosphatase (non-canonical NTP hydrolase)
MDIQELLDFIDKEDKRIRNHYGNYPDEEKRILARTVKLMEEVGELSNDVLSFNSMQRKEKLARHDRENIREEFADVLITTLLLAKSMNIDVKKALENKIQKMQKRNY